MLVVRGGEKEEEEMKIRGGGGRGIGGARVRKGKFDGKEVKVGRSRRKIDVMMRKRREGKGRRKGEEGQGGKGQV